MGRREKQRSGRGISLNLILWFSFTAFALLLVLGFMMVQNFFLGQRYRRETVDSLKSAASDMIASLEGSDGDNLTALAREIRRLEEEYGISLRFLNTVDGRDVFSEGSNSAVYPEFAEKLRDKLSGETRETVLSGDGVLAYATVVSLRGQSCFLCASSSIARLNSLEDSLKWVSLVTALFSVVLAFVVSGFLAMLITKPVTEVTDRAKELARGRYDLNFKRDYYCSEMTDLSDALEYARQEISRTDAMQRELIANVSHDFKTPLTMIKAYASMIREISGDDPPKRDSHARIIIEESDRLTALVNDVLDLSKLRAGMGGDPPVPFDLSELVRRAVSRFDYLAETQGYVFTVEIAEDISAFANPDSVEQVVYNLIGNAVNYTGEDKEVRIRLFSVPHGSRLEIEDTGKGIPEEEIATIWDRYYRTKTDHTRPVQGTGLGLSIVKEILIRQNCPFGVNSEVGKGSCFWVEFPSSEKAETRPHKGRREENS